MRIGTDARMILAAPCEHKVSKLNSMGWKTEARVGTSRHAVDWSKCLLIARQWYVLALHAFVHLADPLLS